MTAAVIDTYEVTITHDRLAGPLVMELIGTSEKAAISRARLAAFHMYRDACMLDAAYEITGRKVGVWPDGREAAS
jgi:hypothetical protein